MALPATVQPEALRLVSSWPEDVRAAFALYLDLPAGSRSLARVSEALGGTPAASTLGNWSASYGWVDLAKGIINARAAGAALDTYEHIALSAALGSAKLVELLNAQRSAVTPKGDVVTMPDLKLQLAAAESLLDRAGLGAVSRSTVAVTGADGGPVRVAHLHADVQAMSPAELLAHLKEQIQGGS